MCIPLGLTFVFWCSKIIELIYFEWKFPFLDLNMISSHVNLTTFWIDDVVMIFISLNFLLSFFLSVSIILSVLFLYWLYTRSVLWKFFYFLFIKFFPQPTPFENKTRLHWVSRNVEHACESVEIFNKTGLPVVNSSVGRALSFSHKGPWFKSQHGHLFVSLLICDLIDC
jgi:hypothetical protein